MSSSVFASTGDSVSASAYPQTSGASAGGSATGASGETGAGATGYGGFGAGSPNQLISVWVDYSALIVVALFMLVALPRLFARFTTSGTSGWMSGLLLYKAPVLSSLDPTGAGSSRNDRSAQLFRQPTNATLRGDVDSSQSHTLAAHGYGYGQSSSSNQYSKYPSSAAHLATTAKSPFVNAPVHLRSPSSVFHPISSFFTYSYAPGKSIGGALLTLAYVAGLLVAVFIDSGDPLVDPEREGWIAISLVPVLVALGTKNNLVGMLVGMGYERVRSLLLHHEILRRCLIFISCS